MRIHRRCFPCILNQLLGMGAALALDDERMNAVYFRALRLMAAAGVPEGTAPEFAERLYDGFVEATGCADPYRRLRQAQNRMILDRIDFFRDQITGAADPLRRAARYALMGNIMDYGVAARLDPAALFEDMESWSLRVDDYAEFRDRLEKSDRVLVIADNAGEIVFDRLLIEQMITVNPRARFFYAVRSKPAINDVILRDAREVGIGRFAEILESGSTFAGTLLGRSTPQFRRLFCESDLIVSKGQGNFETLEGEAGDPLFVFQIKCQVVADHTGLGFGDRILGFRSGIRSAAGVL